jgi:Ca2+-binding RTX toxin-like protein
LAYGLVHGVLGFVHSESTMTITTQERTNIIELTVAMFHAAPGATYLAQLTSSYEANGHDLEALAISLGNSGIYQSLFPASQTAGDFAAAFLTPLGLQANAIALDFIHAKLDAGESKGQIAFEAAVALNGTNAPEFANAKAILINETAVAEYYSVTVANPETGLGPLQQAISTVTADHASVDAAIVAMTSSGAQVINLTSANDTYTIGAGNFSINGLGGDDTITTGGGNNTVTTVAGNDTITTGAGADTILAGDGNNTVNAGNGANSVTTGAGNDTVTTGSGNDTIDSGAGGDIISAGAGADHVVSGAGNDSIDLGTDSAVDTVVFASTAAGNGSDVITHFTTGIDKLDLHLMTSHSSAVAVSGGLTVGAGNVYFLASGLSSAADSISASAALINSGAVWTNGNTGAVAFFVVTDDNSSAMYQYVEAGGAGITVTELTLMGTVDAKIVTGDLMFA